MWDRCRCTCYGGPSNVFQYAFPSVPGTNTTLPPALVDGLYNFDINYEANVATSIIATTPLDGSHNPPPNWNSLALFDTGNQTIFGVKFYPPIPPSAAIPILPITPSTTAGILTRIRQATVMTLSDVWWGAVHRLFSTDAEAGGGAVAVFRHQHSMDAFFQTFTAWTNTLSGSFSVSVWINTTTTVGNDSDNLNGTTGRTSSMPILSAPGTIPVGLTGSKVAFLTIDADGNADTLHSQQSVTTGNYVHIVSTRDQTTGQKCIYINGHLDSCNYASTALLSGETSGNIGGHWGYAGYTGLVDDAQIYSGVLLAADVSNLFANPGTTIANAVASSSFSSAALGAALNTTNLTWIVLGEAPWFVETTNSNDGVSAAQSGSLLDSQSSIIETTVTGPGTLTFYWACSASDDSFDLEFDVDGNYYDDISMSSSWSQDPQVGAVDPTFTIPAGLHVLSWDANTFNDTGSSPDDAGWLDDVVYTPAYQAPAAVTLLSPLLVGTNLQFSFVSQTNHTNFVQYNTNLAQTNWLPYSTIIGDGTTKTVSAPANSPKQEFFRVETQ